MDYVNRRFILGRASGALLALATFAATPLFAAEEPVRAPLPGGAGVELLMVDEPGCIWCARWRAEIGPIYPLTEEGERAPLRMIDIREAVPEGITLTSAPRVTPTFVLLHDGAELSRIEGYPGEDFFWGLLGMMLGDLPEDAEPAPEPAPGDEAQEAAG